MSDKPRTVAAQLAVYGEVLERVEKAIDALAAAEKDASNYRTEVRAEIAEIKRDLAEIKPVTNMVVSAQSKLAGAVMVLGFCRHFRGPWFCAIEGQDFSLARVVTCLISRRFNSV
jgi:hypothetical protein